MDDYNILSCCRLDTGTKRKIAAKLTWLGVAGAQKAKEHCAQGGAQDWTPREKQVGCDVKGKSMGEIIDVQYSKIQVRNKSEFLKIKYLADLLR